MQGSVAVTDQSLSAISDLIKLKRLDVARTRSILISDWLTHTTILVSDLLTHTTILISDWLTHTILISDWLTHTTILVSDWLTHTTILISDWLQCNTGSSDGVSSIDAKHHQSGNLGRFQQL